MITKEVKSDDEVETKVRDKGALWSRRKKTRQK